MSKSASAFSDQVVRLPAAGHPAASDPLEAAYCVALDSTLFSLQAWKDIAEVLSLSLRELQIVQGVFDDAKDQCIAERMGISQHTVHAHFERLYRKLAVHSRASLMLRVFATYLTVSGDGHPGA